MEATNNFHLSNFSVWNHTAKSTNNDRTFTDQGSSFIRLMKLTIDNITMTYLILWERSPISRL